MMPDIKSMVARAFPAPPQSERFECLHTKIEIRIRTVGAGWTYWKQCTICGAAIGTAIAKNAVTSIGIKPWEDALDVCSFSYEVSKVARAEWEDAKNAYWWELYNAYLRSAEWQERRRLVLERDRAKCQGCLIRRAMEVHHLTYDHVGNELLFELVSLCKHCHDSKAHDYKNRDVA